MSYVSLLPYSQWGNWGIRWQLTFLCCHSKSPTDLHTATLYSLSLGSPLPSAENFGLFVHESEEDLLASPFREKDGCGYKGWSSRRSVTTWVKWRPSSRKEWEIWQLWKAESQRRIMMMMIIIYFLKGEEGTWCAGRVMHYTACRKKVALEKLLTRLWLRKEMRESRTHVNPLSQAQATFLPPRMMQPEIQTHISQSTDVYIQVKEHNVQ